MVWVSLDACLTIRRMLLLRRCARVFFCLRILLLKPMFRSLLGFETTANPLTLLSVGNPRRCELPRCQLARLRLLMSRLREQTPYACSGPNDRELLLWCDTLCCPVVNATDTQGVAEQRRHKSLALSRMRNVYAEATYVLVLDGSIERYSYAKIGPFEAGMRLLTSRWMRRLWTLQEAALADRLIIQFVD